MVEMTRGDKVIAISAVLQALRDKVGLKYAVWHRDETEEPKDYKYSALEATRWLKSTGADYMIAIGFPISMYIRYLEKPLEFIEKLEEFRNRIIYLK